MTRLASATGAVVMLLASNAYSIQVTSFEGAMQPTSPAAGWTYLWNELGPIGNTANYSPLLPTTHPNFYYDGDGVNGLPGPSQLDASLFFGLEQINGVPGGHPGLGAGDVNSGGIERYAIALYTVGTPGIYSIESSRLENANNSSDGVSLKVYLNDNLAPLISSGTAGGLGQSVTFDTSLGTLASGDRIYVAVGSITTHVSDSFNLRYRITMVPELCSLNMATAGWTMAIAILRSRKRLAKRQKSR